MKDKKFTEEDMIGFALDYIEYFMAEAKKDVKLDPNDLAGFLNKNLKKYENK